MDEWDELEDMDGAGIDYGRTLQQPQRGNPIVSTAYPDPEEIPSYPWFGAKVAEKGARTPTSLLPSNPLTTFDDDSGDEDGIITEDGEQMHAHIDLNDALIDPDFQYSGDSTVSDDPLSEADFEMQPLSPKRRGRPPKKAGCLPGPRRSNTRGRGGRRAARGAPGVKRGPRKPLEPNLEFKALHSQATMAFIAHDYDEAEYLALQAINQNPEMFAAHSLLSEIYLACGDTDKATAALFNGAHTRPGDTQVWLRVAEQLIERDTEDKISLIPDAIYCLTRVLNIQPKNVEIRYQRASLNRKLGYLGRAANEYEQMLKYLPHDRRVLRNLAAVYVELGDAERALQRYEESIAYYQSQQLNNVTCFSWSDVNVCTELWGFDEQYQVGIKRLKSLSRWLLGRGQDLIWENFDTDDREWDLKDEPRRIQVDGFVSGLYEHSSYGNGLPLELRIKLGVYRLKLGHALEAKHHFQWLTPDDYRPGAELFEYGDLFREAADALRAYEMYHDALIYYEPLQEGSESVDASYFCDMALCYWKTGLRDEAEDCYQTALETGDTDVDIRSHLARMCTEFGTSERSMKLSKKLNAAASSKPGPNSSSVSGEQDDHVIEQSTACSSTLAPLAKKPFSKPSALERQRHEQEQEQLEQERDGKLADQFVCLQESNTRSREGDVQYRREWMSAAQILIQDFRSNSIFYSTDKHMKFFGYTSEARAMSNASKATQAAMSGDLAEEAGLGEAGDRRSRHFDIGSIPQEYRGVRFETWLEIFLEYATTQAQQGHLVEAYDTITAAWGANVFFHSAHSSLLIHVCWFTCALLCNDDATLRNVSRWFMHEYQFTTDAYRLTAAFHRLCTPEKAWYNCSSTQKYLLRQLKAIDFPLVSESQKRTFPAGKAGYTSKDKSGKAIVATDMDVALLMLYGQILYCGRSFAPALNYFFRAHALDPGNSTIHLSIALCYLHHAFKRQSDSRHHLAMQGFSFLSSYYDIRQQSTAPCERQEADYNMARAWHMLGLTHLAVPYYQRCLDHGKNIQASCSDGHAEDFTLEAAVALQGIWAMAGELDKARQLSEAWLIV